MASKKYISPTRLVPPNSTIKHIAYITYPLSEFRGYVLIFFPVLKLRPQSQFTQVNDADLKAMDNQISGLSTQVQSINQSCRQLDAGDATYIWFTCCISQQQKVYISFSFNFMLSKLFSENMVWANIDYYLFRLLQVTKGINICFMV